MPLFQFIGFGLVQPRLDKRVAVILRRLATFVVFDETCRFEFRQVLVVKCNCNTLPFVALGHVGLVRHVVNKLRKRSYPVGRVLEMLKSVAAAGVGRGSKQSVELQRVYLGSH